MHDRLVWAGTKTGQFTLRSAYHLELARRARPQASCSASASTNPIWKLIWQLKILRTTQIFIWRACNEILPTKEKLCKRRIVDDPHCPLCGQAMESSGHALWGCSAAGAIWYECPSQIGKCNFSAPNCLSLVSQLSTRLDREDLELWIMVAQRIWL